jgi:hypothetical protein
MHIHTCMHLYTDTKTHIRKTKWVCNPFCKLVISIAFSWYFHRGHGLCTWRQPSACSALCILSSPSTLILVFASASGWLRLGIYKLFFCISDFKILRHRLRSFTFRFVWCPRYIIIQTFHHTSTQQASAEVNSAGKNKARADTTLGGVLRLPSRHLHGPNPASSQSTCVFWEFPSPPCCTRSFVRDLTSPQREQGVQKISLQHLCSVAHKSRAVCV